MTRLEVRAVTDSLFFPTFASCPGCSGPVRGESSADLTVFVCVRCGTSWHVELGVVYQVDVPAGDGARTPGVPGVGTTS